MTPNLPTIRQIQFLIALREQGNFTLAAEACFVTQSTLSAGIKEMETILGAPVIDRSARKQLRFTPLGEEILANGQRTVQNLTEITERARRLQKPFAWPLRLGIIPTIAPYLLPQLLQPLQEKFPILKLNVHEVQSSQLVDRIIEGRLDFGILALPYETHDLHVSPLIEEPFYAAVPESWAKKRRQISLSEIQEQKLLLLSDGHCLSDHVLAACNMKQLSRLQDVSATSLSTLMQLVSHGYGVTLLPEMVIRNAPLPTGLHILPLSPDAPTRKIGIAWRKNAVLKTDIEELAKAITELMHS